MIAPALRLALALALVGAGCSSGSNRPAAQLRSERAASERAWVDPTSQPVEREPAASERGARSALEQPPAATYALGALPPELGAVRWPAPPRIARELTIDGGRAVIDQEGTRVVLRGALDRLAIEASDVEIRATPGSYVAQLTIARGLSRIRVAGGRYGAIELPVPAQHVPPPAVWRREWLASDVTIDGVQVDASDTAFSVRGRRVAILNSRVVAARYSVWCGDTHEFQTEDLVLAGNHFESAGPESTVRLVGVQRAVIVDNTLSNTFKHDFRVHGVSDRIVFARNRLINTGIMVGSMEGDRIGTVWIVDNEVHHVVPSLFEVSTERVRHLVARGNRVFSDRWSCFVCGRPRAGWEIGDNPVLPYRPLARDQAQPR